MKIKYGIEITKYTLLRERAYQEILHTFLRSSFPSFPESFAFRPISQEWKLCFEF